jgi:phosphate-selective porin OprO/OprP
LTLGDRPELRIDPTPILSTGAIANISHAQVYSAEGAAQFGSLFFEGEYFWYDLERVGQPSLRFNGGYVKGEWTFTGERRKYNPEIGAYHAVVPDHPFSLATHEWGAWEIAGRYSTIDLNDRFVRGIPTAVTLGAAGGEQTVYSFGLNWYPNQNVRLLFDYIYGPVNKFSGAGANPGADIGARFNAVAMRTEFYF